MEPTASQKKIRGSDIFQIESAGAGHARVLIGEECCGVLQSINSQTLQGLHLSKQEQMNLLIQNKIEDLDLEYIGVNQPNGAICRSEIVSDQLDADFSIRFLHVAEGVLGVKLERTEIFSPSSSSSSSSSSRSKVMMDSFLRECQLQGSFVVVSTSPTCQNLKVGDYIVAVNGISLLHLSTPNAIILLQQTIERTLTVVRRYVDLFKLEHALLKESLVESTKATEVLENGQQQSLSITPLEEPLHAKRPLEQTTNEFLMSSHDSLDGWKDIRSKYIHRKMHKVVVSEVESSTKSSITCKFQAAFYCERHNILQDMLSNVDIPNIPFPSQIFD